MLINFLVIQAAPGGPVEKVISQIKGTDIEATAKFAGTSKGDTTSNKTQGAGQRISEKYKGSRGLDPELIETIEKQFGFDKPAHQRFLHMIRDYATLDFGDSFFRGQSVIDLIKDKLPVSISLGLWTTLIVYLISIPLGITKAVRDGSRFDLWTSAGVIIGYAIPGFLFAILLIVFFAGGSFFDLFPLRGLTSENWESLSSTDKILDYLWHITLPVLSMAIAGFASLTMLTKNSFLDEINKQYVITAKSKGLSQKKILHRHVFRNAMLIVIAGFPSAFISILFTGSLLIEVIFSLDGLGLLGFEAAIGRDYPVIFGTLFIYTLVGLILKLISDITYVIIDPRIDFESRET